MTISSSASLAVIIGCSFAITVAGLPTNRRERLRAIEAPTLVIAADPAPPYFTAAQRDERAALLRDGRVATLPGSHHLHMEQPDVVGPVLREFLGAP